VRRFIVFIVIAILFPAGLLSAQGLPGDKGGYTLSPPRTSTLKGADFAYVSVQTTYADMGTVLSAIMMQFDDSMKSGQFLPTGGPVFEYQGAGEDRNKTFTMRIGYPVAAGTKAFGGFQVGKLEPKKSATTVFIGRRDSLSAAYQKLYTQIGAAGLTPGDMHRERYLYYEDEASNNNIMLIEVELKE
jgi:hypothetical protein